MKKRTKDLLKTLHMIFFNPKVIIFSAKLGHGCFIGRKSYINKPKYLILGDGVRIGNDARLSFYDTFNEKKLSPKLVIGSNTYIGNHFTALVADEIILGKEVLIASYVMISSENHGMDPEDHLSYGKQSLITKPVIIEDRVWIGEKVSILPGVRIGEKSIIGTGSVVISDIPPYSIAVGSPAKVIKTYNFNNKKWEKKKVEKK